MYKYTCETLCANFTLRAKKRCEIWLHRKENAESELKFINEKRVSHEERDFHVGSYFRTVIVKLLREFPRRERFSHAGMHFRAPADFRTSNMHPGRSCEFQFCLNQIFERYRLALKELQYFIKRLEP